MIGRCLGQADLKARLMGEMIDRLGIDLVQAARQDLGTRLDQVVRGCRFCAHAEQCQAWLSGMSTADRRDFCPNAALFDDMPRRVN